MLLLTAQGDLRAVLRAHVHVDVWEIFCAPESRLSQAVQSEGMVASRINLHQGYDVYKHDTYVRLRNKFLQERPHRIWISSRCTYIGVPTHRLIIRQLKTEHCWKSIGDVSDPCSEIWLRLLECFL